MQAAPKRVDWRQVKRNRFEAPVFQRFDERFLYHIHHYALLIQRYDIDCHPFGDKAAYAVWMLNRFRRGSMLVAGETMLVLECTPAAYINYAVNEAEKGSTIKIQHVSSVGRFGRMWLSGSESEINTARQAAVFAIKAGRIFSSGCVHGGGGNVPSGKSVGIPTYADELQRTM